MKDRNKSADRGRKEGNFCFRRELKTITIKSTSDGPAFPYMELQYCTGQRVLCQNNVCTDRYHLLADTPLLIRYASFFFMKSFHLLVLLLSMYVCMYVQTVCTYVLTTKRQLSAFVSLGILYLDSRRRTTSSSLFFFFVFFVIAFVVSSCCSSFDSQQWFSFNYTYWDL